MRHENVKFICFINECGLLGRDSAEDIYSYKLLTCYMLNSVGLKGEEGLFINHLQGEECKSQKKEVKSS